MSVIQALAQLQALDQEWDEKGKAFQAIRQKLADESALSAPREAQRQRSDELNAARSALRDVELKMKGLQAKVKEIEVSLYGGRIRNPKELEGLRQDNEHLKAQISQLEDQALALMTRLDELEPVAQRGERELRAFEAHYVTEREALSVQAETLRARLKQLQPAREKLRATLGRAELVLYDELRVKKAGVVLSPMKDGICQVCRVIVPSKRVQLVQTGATVVTCDSCGRILYLPGTE